MPRENPNESGYKTLRIREFPPQDGITLTVRLQIYPPKRKVTITIENATNGRSVCIKLDATVRDEILDAIEWIKSRELPESSKDIIQQIRYEKSGFVVMREIQPYEKMSESFKSQYKIGDGEKCNYSFSSVDELERFLGMLWG